MPSLKVKNLPDPLYCALRTRALAHGRSIDAEVRAILERTIATDITVPKLQHTDETGPLPFPWTSMSEMSRAMGLTNEDFEALDAVLAQLRAEQAALYVSSSTPTSPPR
ncbi:FitA-like ribbon-helix-helix domain-containing protein [Pigmentiphaga litoralis]|uniref:FitA-like ribbon-helix-helix domain-containing protein n=1 Tax=Pigmentiphaga litoralis TaxID=516702 RepID=UPI003B43D61A